MPRNLGAKKHQHNNRHENGLVGPGKRITKQKSNGHLNGNAKGSIPTEPLPSANPIEQQSHVTSPNGNETTIESPRRVSQTIHRSKETDSGCETNKQDHASRWESTNGSTMPPRKIEITTTRSKSSQDVSAFHIAQTILRSRPACDTIALLIVLLALPSIVLTIVQALFASLTIMPGAGLSPVSFLSIFDVFQGSAGSPSLGTMAIVDMFCFGLWICLWNWAQNFALDLAQIQIAITLGNGTAGKNSSINTFCLTVVLFLHAIRSKGVRRFVVSNLVPSALVSNPNFTEIMKYLPGDSDFGDSPGLPSKIRSIFAIHILSQAFMAFVRRQVANSQAGSNPKQSKRLDAEASAGSTNPDALHSDIPGTAGTSSSIDYHPPPTPGFKDGRDKGLSAKKRRKYANQVRSRQPFWAALASTKVHVLREVEHNKGLPNTTANQTVPFEAVQQDLVWITDVDPSSILFEAHYSGSIEKDQEFGEIKPFYVRINGARWPNMALETLHDDDRAETSQLQFHGSISGLAPNCTYTCSFCRSDDDDEFACVMVRTPALLDKDLPSSLLPAPARQSTRPSSPTTTLKNSIASADLSLNDAKGRLTKVKRQHRATLAKVEKEVESLQGRLKSSTDDTKLRQKLLQAERNMRQTEGEAKDIDAALEDLVTIPEDETVDYSERKTAYEKKTKELSEANERLSSAKSTAKHDLSCINTELNAVIARKERLTSRQVKLSEQHDRINQANVQGMDEKERRAAESAAREAEQSRREAEITTYINYMAGELRDLQLRTQASWREIEALEKQDMSQRQNLLLNSGPLTPEGDLPGTRPQGTRPFPYSGFQALPGPNMTLEPQGSPFLAFAKTLPSDNRRPRSDTNRSTGAVSNISADFEDADPIPPMLSNMDINGRKGSGSSRGQNNGSPAGGMIGPLRSPRGGSNSPGHMPGTTTW